MIGYRQLDSHPYLVIVRPKLLSSFWPITVTWPDNTNGYARYSLWKKDEMVLSSVSVQHTAVVTTRHQIVPLTWQFPSEDLIAAFFPPSVVLLLVRFLLSRRQKGRTQMNLIRIFCPLRIKSDNGISFCAVKVGVWRDWTVCSSKWHFSPSFMHLFWVNI